VFLIYHRSSRPTGQVLAQALGIEHGENLPRGPIDVLIRWGSQRVSDGYHAAGARTINTPQALRAASDKLGTLRTLREAGVRVPDFSTNPEELELPILGRRLKHARGSDIVLCLQSGDWARRSRDYYVKYIPTKREYRIHVVNGRVIRTQGKFLDVPGDAVPWVRNYKHGYRFRAPRRGLHQSRLDAAKNAVAALGLDFGAVDIIIGDDNLEYVLEVNTAPACSPLTARGYVDALAGLAGISRDQLRYDRLNALSQEYEDSAETEEEDDEGS